MGGREMSDMLRFAWPFLATLLSLTGCQSTPPVYEVPAGQSFDRPPAAIRPAVIDFIDANGLTVAEKVEDLEAGQSWGAGR